MSCEADEILRFRTSERHLHWAIAVPFKVCYVTALILVTVYNPHPHRPFREVVSWIHRLSGICLAVLPPCAIAWHWRDFRTHLANVRIAWTWSRDDLKWLALMGPAALTRRVSLPDQGKFNAAEKINFMALTATYPLYVMTGVTIWFFGVPYLSWLVHFSLAIAATPLLVGHVFMATVNPDTRIGLNGMLTGMVDRGWARHHYRRWYEDQVHDVRGPAPDAAARSPVVPVASPASALSARRGAARPADEQRLAARPAASVIVAEARVRAVEVPTDILESSETVAPAAAARRQGSPPHAAGHAESTRQPAPPRPVRMPARVAPSFES